MWKNEEYKEKYLRVLRDRIERVFNYKEEDISVQMEVAEKNKKYMKQGDVAVKSKLLLIFLVLILSFNIFSNTNSKEKFKLAKTYLDHKNYREAEKIYLELAKEKDIHAIYNLGYLYMEQGKIVEGEKYYKMAMDKGSREAEAEYNTILIMEEHGL